MPVRCSNPSALIPVASMVSGRFSFLLARGIRSQVPNGEARIEARGFRAAPVIALFREMLAQRNKMIQERRPMVEWSICSAAESTLTEVHNPWMPSG